MTTFTATVEDFHTEARTFFEEAQHAEHGEQLDAGFHALALLYLGLPATTADADREKCAHVVRMASKAVLYRKLEIAGVRGFWTD